MKCNSINEVSSYLCLQCCHGQPMSGKDTLVSDEALGLHLNLKLSSILCKLGIRHNPR